MPGNPIPEPTKDLKQSGFTYTPEDGWGDPPVTAAPKAVFDAQTGEQANKAFGYVEFSSSKPNVEIPDSGGLRGIQMKYAGKDMFSNSNTNEINYKLLVHQNHVWEKIKVFQPANYHCAREMYFQVDPAVDDISNWEIGDALQAGSYTGIIEAFEGDNTVGVSNYTGHPFNSWGAGDTITNVTKGLSVTSTKGNAKAGLSKFMSLWTSDDPTLQDRGYSNSGIFMGMQSDLDYDNPDESGSSFGEITTTTSDYGLPTQKMTGQTSNALGGHFKIFDTADNGSVVEFFMERKRSSAFGVSDGLVRVWKHTYRVGSDYEDWELVYEDLSVNIFSSFHDNNFTHGYIFGNKNGTYREDTYLYFMGYELWLAKPDFLPEAA